MNWPFEWQLGWRYTRAGRAGRRDGFISFISGVSMLGIALGVAALIIILSVMNGFQKEVTDRMLSVVSHVEVLDANGGDERSLSAPHEMALAGALGWPAIDGRLPLAARMAVHDGVDTGTRAVGLLTPVHLHLGTEQVTMTDPATLDVEAADARELFDALLPLFADVGFDLHWGDALRWYLVHDSLAEWPTASLDRVIGRNIDPWITVAPGGHLWPRVQSETQMLLHTHPVNARREALGLASINSVWLSGCGTARTAYAVEPRVDDRPVSYTHLTLPTTERV